MKINVTLKCISIAVACSALLVVAFLVYALAGFGANPVVYETPPAFVERYAAKMNYSLPPSSINKAEILSDHAESSTLKDLTKEFSDVEKLVLKLILEGNSSKVLVQLFTRPEKAERVKVASAFAAVNAKLTHNEESGFPEKRGQFWLDVEAHLPDIQNALFEALIVSAEAGTTNYIPYTLAWMPGQGQETVEVLAWAAKHHPDPWVRRFSLFFVVEFGQNEELAELLLNDRTHDPEYRVRKEVLEQRFRRFKEIFSGENRA